MSIKSGTSQAARRDEAVKSKSNVKKGSTLTVDRILFWADAHRTATGQWPNSLSGPVIGETDQVWSAIDSALKKGHRGLPGKSSLARLLDEERGVTKGQNLEAPAERLRAWEAEKFPARRPRQIRRHATTSSSTAGGRSPLTIDRILFWADAHRTATGQWPNLHSGPVTGETDELWSAIDSALRRGSRGLPGESSLRWLLEEERGVTKTQNPEAQAGEGENSPTSLPRQIRRHPTQTRARTRLSIDMILASADAHHAATGDWPANNSGPMRDYPELNWAQVNRALISGSRGLSGGTTLADLLQDRRGVRNKQNLARLNIEQILEWADAYREATGEFPMGDSGPVREAPGETWKAIQSALVRGLRGLTAGSSLTQLLAERREYRGLLTIDRILGWADAHHEATGRWPTSWSSGVVRHAQGEAWENLNAALRDGRRGLSGGTTLAQMLAKYRQIPNIYTEEPLTAEKILGWADAHRETTGRWPSSNSGPVLHAEGENWGSIETALREGYRSLPGGQSVGRLVREHAGLDAYRIRPVMTVEQILAWADAHREATGEWPIEDAGPVLTAEGENWNAVSGALFVGSRGLPGGSSLAKLLAEHRGVRNRQNLPHLNVEQILAWADAHREATGRWPSNYSGPVAEGSEETWAIVNSALTSGLRGLPGGSSLACLLADHRPVRPRRLSLKKIRAWALVHREATGRWPDAHAGPVIGVPDEVWSAVNSSLVYGRRGLPGGTSLTDLFGRSFDPDARRNRPDLTIDQILGWADAHREATGRWPSTLSGQVTGVPGEKWVNLQMALKFGRRALPGGTNLARLIAEHRGGPAAPPANATRSRGGPNAPAASPESR